MKTILDYFTLYTFLWIILGIVGFVSIYFIYKLKIKKTTKDQKPFNQEGSFYGDNHCSIEAQRIFIGYRNIFLYERRLLAEELWCLLEEVFKMKYWTIDKENKIVYLKHSLFIWRKGTSCEDVWNWFGGHFNACKRKKINSLKEDYIYHIFHKKNKKGKELIDLLSDK